MSFQVTSNSFSLLLAAIRAGGGVHARNITRGIQVSNTSFKKFACDAFADGADAVCTVAGMIFYCSNPFTFQSCFFSGGDSGFSNAEEGFSSAGDGFANAAGAFADSMGMKARLRAEEASVRDVKDLAGDVKNLRKMGFAKVRAVEILRQRALQVREMPKIWGEMALPLRETGWQERERV